MQAVAEEQVIQLVQVVAQVVAVMELITVLIQELLVLQTLVAVAEAGETMPQKSTLFAPKPPTGLLFLAHEINRVG